MEHEIPASSKIMGNVITMRLAVYNNYLRGRRGVKGRERERARARQRLFTA